MPLAVGDFDAVTDPTPYRRNSEPLKAEYLATKQKRLEKTIELLETKSKSDPENKPYRFALCDCHVALGDILIEKKDIQSAMREYESAFKANDQCQKAKDKLKSLSK